jgi:Flp pilus assembly protein TadG
VAILFAVLLVVLAVVVFGWLVALQVLDRTREKLRTAEATAAGVRSLTEERDELRRRLTKVEEAVKGGPP